MTDTFTQTIFNLTKNDSVCFQNMLYILERLKMDKTFDQLSQIFERVIDREIVFAASGALNRAPTAQS